MKKKKQKRKLSPAKAKKKTILAAVCITGAALLIILFINLMFRRTLDRYDPDIIINGVFIGDTDVSGMTEKEAGAAVQAQTEQLGDGLIVLDLGEGREARATLRELGLSVKDLEQTVEKAVQYGKQGGTAERYKILKASEKGKEKHFPIRYQVTGESARDVLQGRTKGVLDEPRNASLTRENGSTVIRDDVPGEELNIEETAAQINRFLEEDWNKEEGRVQAVLQQVQASITKEDLQEIPDVLGTFHTNYADSTDARKKNIESGAGHINGLLIRPGEETSVNDLLSPYTPENGYENAPSYAGNEVVDSMGGGICQVSTTLYNALLYAEIQITERHEHSMLVGYVDPSRDAAIAENLKDLRFKNNLENPIYIEAVTDGGTLTFNVYGKEYREPGRTVEYESETTGTVEPEVTEYIGVDEAIGTIYTQSVGHKGSTARLWKVVSENGTQISRDVINNSFYLAGDNRVAVGTWSQDPAETEKMKQAVQTQDLAVIERTIEEITKSRGSTDSEEGQGET